MADIFDFYVYDDRSIRFEIAEPIMLEDKDVTQFRFRIPKSLNGFDMTDWEWWFIFVNPKGTKYTTLLELTDDEDEPGEYSIATYTVGYGFSGIVGTVRFSIEAINVSGEDIVNEWHTKTYNTAVIDTLQGLRAVIPEPDGQVSTGITEEVKQALLQIARKVAYIDEHGQTYYNALYDALYAITAVIITPKSISLTSIGATSQLSARTVPEGGTVAWSSSNTNVATVDQNGLVTSVAWGSATITATSGGKSGTCSVLVSEATLTEISAVYTPSGTVYESDSLDSLKSDLVVTSHWSNGTTSTVPSADYTLSGTLAVGTDTITVSYGGMTTTFDVTVVGLTGISAVYTQSGTVYDTDTLDSLRSDLVVTATYSDSTTAVVTDYTLSGTLTAGTSTITVSYGGKTTTFNVTVTQNSTVLGYTGDNLLMLLDGIANGVNGAHNSTISNLIDQSGNNKNWESSNGTVTATDNALVFNGSSELKSTWEGTAMSEPKTIEIVLSVTNTSTTQCLLCGLTVTSDVTNDKAKTGIGALSVKGGNLLHCLGSTDGCLPITSGIHTYTFVNNDGTWEGYIDGVKTSFGSTTVSWKTYHKHLGAFGRWNDNVSAYFFTGSICYVRYYSEALTAQEVSANRANDVARFNT